MKTQKAQSPTSVNIFPLQELLTNEAGRFTGWVSGMCQEQKDNIRTDAEGKRALLKWKQYKSAVEFPTTATAHQNRLYVICPYP